MRATAALVDATAAAAREVLRLERPADGVLAAFFRSHPKLGQHDRAFVAETVYALLRRKRLVQHAVAETGLERADARHLALAAAVRVRGLNVRELGEAVGSGEAQWLEGVKAAARGPLPFAVDCDLPDWVIARLLPAFGEAGLARLARALNQPAPLDLRVNVAKSERDAVLERFAADAIAASPTPYSPVGIRLRDKPAINRHPLFTAGAIEVQDEGSQLLCHLLAPRRGEMLVDFCAGAGGKSLALGALMRSTGRVYAFDVSARRLGELRPRLARSGLSNVHPQAIASERDPRVKRLSGKIDRVLVDAPCTGLGTLRRNPDLKWRQTEAAVAELAAKQRAILDAAAALVRAGGRLLYATCSLLAEENEHVVQEFIARNAQFRLVPARAALAAGRIAIPPGEPDDDYLRLRPDVHGTDGFFGALMEHVT
ncbi:MAG TPA: RsmB/NOP family class I SAM-dependent RNA methyltransferase [Burkholderiales bacterium]|nr:RsmB/NOP family class I SAM-dependent RNA methyltransferase [Burkholderiales bacterium]